MKALEDEYEALQRKVWKAKPADTEAADVKRLKGIRKAIGNESARSIREKIIREKIFS